MFGASRSSCLSVVLDLGSVAMVTDFVCLCQYMTDVQAPLDLKWQRDRDGRSKEGVGGALNKFRKGA